MEILHRNPILQCWHWGQMSCCHSPHYNWIKRQFSFWFLNCNIGQPNQPVCAKLPSSSCLQPWPHPGKGTLPMPDQVGKLSLEKNGGYSRPKGSFHPSEGQGINCPLPGLRAKASLEGEAVSTREAVQLYCVCTQYSWTGFQQFVYTVLYICTLYSLTGF